MWILKGTLLGLVIFVVGGFSYVLIRMGIGLYQAMRAAKAGSPQPLIATDIQVIILNPIFWLALLVAVSLGLWIVRARTTHKAVGDGGTSHEPG